jgi:hypothetical protein
VQPKSAGRNAIRRCRLPMAKSKHRSPCPIPNASVASRTIGNAPPIRGWKPHPRMGPFENGLRNAPVTGCHHHAGVLGSAAPVARGCLDPGSGNHVSPPGSRPGEVGAHVELITCAVAMICQPHVRFVGIGRHVSGRREVRSGKHMSNCIYASSGEHVCSGKHMSNRTLKLV